jgi:hypothetical protein
LNKRLKKVKKSRMRGLSPNYTLRAPPYDIYSPFQPVGFSKLYHNCEEARMKRSYEWVYSALKAEEEKKKLYNKIQEEIRIEDGILIIKIRVDDKPRILNIDLKEYLSIVE